MAIERVINYVVGADGKVTCNGTRRPQSAGVQGDDGVCKLIFDMSAVYTGKERYFIEFVCGCGTPIILSEDSDGVEFDTQTKKLNVVLGKEVTTEGATVEVQIVEEVLDVENNATAEGNTYVTYIEFQNKSGVMTKLKETAYGVFVDCKNIMQKALINMNEAINNYTNAKKDFDNAVGQISEVKKVALQRQIVSELPTENIKANVIYLVPKENATDDDKYDEYIFIPDSDGI